MDLIRKKAISEHDHLGPYFYLKLMTWNSPEITASTWSGSLPDFLRLAALIEQHLSNLVKNEFFIGSDYSSSSTAKIHFIIESDGLDPSTVDDDIQHRI
jgi:hypothetical protein